MANKIFVSYKYSDAQVAPLGGLWMDTTARDYVDEIASFLEDDDHIYKGEDDGESMNSLADSTISSKLGDKIFDSSITIVLISKGMKTYHKESDQWIPWEISYSLRQQSRGGRTSKSNGILAVILPDQTGSYGYFIQEDGCPYCKCRILKTDFLFPILRKNMFNIKNGEYSDCPHHVKGTVFLGLSSYIHSVKWVDFIIEPQKYIDVTNELKSKLDNYNIIKTLE